MDSDYYKFYDFLRKRPPIKMEGSWLISKYEDIKYILEQTDQFRSSRIAELFSTLDQNNIKVSFAKEHLSNWILHYDDKSSEIKKIITQDLYGYLKTSLSEKTNELMERLLNDNLTKEKFDFKADIVIPILTTILLDMLKVPKGIDEALQHQKAFYHLQNIAQLITKLQLTESETESFAISLLYIAKLGPGFNGCDDKFFDEEYKTQFNVLDMQKGMIYNAFLHDTTNYLCNVFYVLNNNSDKFSMEQLESAIEEAARLEPAVQALVRTATCNTEVRGQKIMKNDILTLLIGSANRDGSEGESSSLNTFALNRSVRSLSFGHGLHICLGKHFSKELARVIMPKVLFGHRFCVEDMQWNEQIRTYRSMDYLILRKIK